MTTSSYSFPKALRLLTSGDFQSVFSDAPIRAAHKHLLILTRPNGLDYPRLGLVIAKKHIRKATQRNQIKRKIRESFRLRQHTLAGIDAIVLARSGLDQLDKAQQAQLLAQQWARIEKKLGSSGKSAADS